MRIALAPSNLGLSPVGNKQQGAWRAPQALLHAGLARSLDTDEVISLERPGYQFAAQPGTRTRNGVSIRAFSLQMAEKVADIIQIGQRDRRLTGTGIAQRTVQRARRRRRSFGARGNREAAGAIARQGVDVVGADFAIYDPERDSRSRYAGPLVLCIADALRL